MTWRQWLLHYGAVIVTALLAALAARWGITIPTPPPPPIAAQPPAPSNPPPAPQPAPNPLLAICQISAPGVGCSATVIGPRREDGRYWVLSAAHCVRAGGERWQMRFRDGTRASMTIVARDDQSDWSWGVTDSSTQPLPYAILARTTAPDGAPVWVAGYGIGENGRRRDGTAVGGLCVRGQAHYRIEVASGDSGGGIIETSTGHVLSPVCCTSGMGRSADVWGACPEMSGAGKPRPTDSWDWHPMPIPKHKE